MEVIKRVIGPLLIALVLALSGQVAAQDKGAVESPCGPLTLVQGRILTSGQVEPRARVSLIYDQGVWATTLTSVSGYYVFNNVQPCITYTLIVKSKRPTWYPEYNFLVDGSGYPIYLDVNGFLR